MDQPQRQARLAGALYLAIIVLGLGAELAVRGRLVAPADAEATAAALLGAPWLWRAGVAADALMMLADVALALLLFRLLAPAGRGLSLAAMVFRLMQAALIAVSLLLSYGALLWLEAGGTAPEALLLVGLHAHGYDLGLVFFGVSSLLVGLLVLRADYLPGWIGALLMAAGVVYLAGSSLRFLAPALHGPFQPVYLVPVLAEASFCLWLLIRGVGPRFPAAVA